jgi:hypothetical protein
LPLGPIRIYYEDYLIVEESTYFFYSFLYLLMEPPGSDSTTDMVEVAAMKLAYPSGMYTTQVIDVNVVPFVDITVDKEGELNTGKGEQKNVSYGKL